MRQTLEEKLNKIAPEIAVLRKKTLERKATDIQAKQKIILARERSNTTGYNVMPLAKSVTPLAKSVTPLAKSVTPLANNVRSIILGETIQNKIEPREFPGNLVCPFLRNGLGNRIFQVLAALGYAEKYGKKCVISKANINNGSKPHEKNLDGILSKLFPNIAVVDKINNPRIITERLEFNYNNLPILSSNIILQGYFQDERYFPLETSELIPKIKTDHYPNTYFIHIRAGDYLHKGSFGYDLSCYHQRCIDMLSPDTKYIVFSDDVKYARNYMTQFDIFYTISDKINQLDTLIEMSNCEGAICANSSFSWLGAFFQDKTKGRRFMPSQWIKGRNTSGIYPEWASVISVKLQDIQDTINILPLHDEVDNRLMRIEVKMPQVKMPQVKMPQVNIPQSDINDLGNKTIIHVLDYSSGFGDFLRGSILLAEYAKHLNIQIKLNTSRHILSKYLENEIEEIPSTENVNIIQITKNPENRLLPLFENFIKSNSDNIYLATNYLYDKNLVTQEIKDFINYSLKFKQEYYDKANMLFSLKKYIVLHIRCKDDKFESDIDDHDYDKLLCEIIKLQLNNDTIVISNNYPLKKKLHSLFGFHYIDNMAIHSAKVNDYRNLESTILDYIILSKSHRTYCFSYYSHGSGFSEQCSILHNIPYSVIFVSPTDKLSVEDKNLLSTHHDNLKNNNIIPYGFSDLEASYETREHTNISFITLTNNGYLDYTLNCLKSVELAAIKTKLKVYCIGEQGVTILQNKGITSNLINDKYALDFQKFRSNNWSNVVFHKFKIIYDNLLNNEYVCITDGDIVYENNCIFDYLLKNIKDNDMLIQSEGITRNDLCSGFMFIKSNQNTISLFNPNNVERYRNTVGWGDQIYVNSIKDKLKYKKLPLPLFPTGKYFYQYSGEINPYLIHFNWVVGHEKRNKMIKYNKWYMLPRADVN